MINPNAVKEGLIRIMRTAVGAGLSALVVSMLGDISQLPMSNFYMPALTAVLVGVSKFVRDNWGIDLKIV